MNLAKVYTTAGHEVIGAANKDTIRAAIDHAFGPTAVLKADWSVWLDGKQVGVVKWNPNPPQNNPADA